MLRVCAIRVAPHLGGGPASVERAQERTAIERARLTNRLPGGKPVQADVPITPRKKALGFAGYGSSEYGR